MVLSSIVILHSPYIHVLVRAFIKKDIIANTCHVLLHLYNYYRTVVAAAAGT